jgi:hypothetical protein
VFAHATAWQLHMQGLLSLQEVSTMPQKATIERARADKRAGKSASTQAGEFVHDEIKRIRAGKHGAKNAKQAIAIGLSEARRAGVDVKPKKGSAARPKKAAPKARSAGKRKSRATSSRRSQAALRALKKQPTRSASHLALSRQAHAAARSRSKASRSAAARKGARTRARTAH